MKLSKEKKRCVRLALYNYFQPLHKHLGFENSSTIFQIVKAITKRCRIKFANDDEERIFRETTTSKIFQTLMDKQCSYYLRGLQCELVGRLGHFYFAKTEEEIRRVKQISTKVIDGRINMLSFRLDEIKEWIKQLGYDSSKDMKKLK